MCCESTQALWFAQNSLPLRWQRQRIAQNSHSQSCCDLLKIHYLCGDKYNLRLLDICSDVLWFAQNSLPLRWQIQLVLILCLSMCSCDLLKIHYLCGDKYNRSSRVSTSKDVVICSKFITFAVTNTTLTNNNHYWSSCDLLKIHYLCGDKYNFFQFVHDSWLVVICSKFITFAVTNTTDRWLNNQAARCDLLKIHYLCGDKYNINLVFGWESEECRMF